ncbi:MAG: hypothetical protein WBI55_07740 [Eubacteriales bacterium]|jgi:hypothetical protein|nr:hypothetical protein [Clostridiales bacterium]
MRYKMSVNSFVISRRIIAFILVFTLIIASTGCTSINNENNDTPSDTITDSEAETNTTLDVDNTTEVDTEELKNEYQTITEENATHAVYADHAVVIDLDKNSSTYIIKPDINGIPVTGIDDNITLNSESVDYIVGSSNTFVYD